MAENILAEAPKKSIVLADGKEYTLSNITLTTLANLEDELGYGLGELQTAMEKKTAGTARALLYVLLKENYPKLTPDQVGKLVTMDKFNEVMSLIAEAIKQMSA